VIFVCWLVSDHEVTKSRLELYHRELSSVKPVIGGDDLRAMGLRPGPLYSDLLEALRAARLDGKVVTLEDERSLLQQMIETGTRVGRKDV
jgi:tRNA nucleotidyltransferase (CCA-adding enzyme)